MSGFDSSSLDPVIHGKLRLGVMAFLASAGSASFTVLRDKTGSTDGNLSTHLRKLEDSGYIRQDKKFKNRKPLTLVTLTRKGRTAWIKYLSKMQKLLTPQAMPE